MAGPVIITELSSRAKAGLAPGMSRIHIDDTPLRRLAALLLVGFILTMLLRPLRHDSSQSPIAQIIQSLLANCPGREYSAATSLCGGCNE